MTVVSTSSAARQAESTEVAAAAGLSLLPSRVFDPETSWSCLKWPTSRKHIAAMFYLLGEEFE
ncbi:hypothetical protein JXA88_13655 [Candidatus Fermentibacteria bacterium]|nr:hypothetical protein [Candidatus Fermentibacteria bacterium]